MALTFDPGVSLSGSEETLQDANFVPWGAGHEGGYRRSAAVFTSDGTRVKTAVCWRDVRERVTIDPPIPDMAGAKRLPGRWLFGGLFYAHFGHFLCETLARLWAVDQAGPIDGILFFPKKRMTWPKRLVRPYLPFFELLGLDDVEIVAPQEPLIVEELRVPAQGFGVGEMAAGRPEFRAWIRDRLSRAIAPDGDERIYISRSRLMSKRGGILAEDVLEARLAEEGYRIFHPQDHPIAEQIAQYRAARHIASMDASPLHLAGFVADPTARVAILNRGPSQNIEDYVRQYRHFAGIDPITIDAIERFWFPEGERLVRREAFSLMSFARVGDALAQAGMISRPDRWFDLSPPEIETCVAEQAGRLGKTLRDYPRDA